MPRSHVGTAASLPRRRRPDQPGLLQPSRQRAEISRPETALPDSRHRRVEDGRAIYAVEDNGIGIAPEHQAKVFEILPPAESLRQRGEGLGLTIAQRILERQNGKIWVQSEPGGGSTFFVSLPER